MARPKQEINPQSRMRLKQLCIELNITQQKLAVATGVSENTLSKIATGRGPLTRPIAEEIIKVCPTYRLEWLLGLDDTPHEVRHLYIPGFEDTKRQLAAIDFLSNLGLSVGQITEKGIFIPINELRGFLSPENSVEIKKGDSVIWHGTAQEINNVLQEICDFALFKIEHLCKQREV